MTLDPTTAYATPPQPKQQQEMPGETEAMTPAPDHGETTYKGHGRLTGRAAIITGGDSGIGRAVAIAYAREGADVLISYLSEESDARETARWVEEAGRNAVLLPGDIGDEAHCLTLVERAMTEFGRLDILVNNAAHQASIDSIEEITSEEWDRTMRTNLYAMFYLCKAAVPVMQPGSAIINTSSIQSKSPTPGAPRLRNDQGGDFQLYCRPRRDAGGEGHPGERRRARADLDAAHPLDAACREGRELRKRYTARAGRPASRARRRLRAAGLRRGQLHLGRRYPGDGRKADAVRLRGGDGREHVLARPCGIFAPAEPCRLLRVAEDVSTKEELK